jgi:hypothetical protein
MTRLVIAGVVLLFLLILAAPAAAELPPSIYARVDFGRPGFSYVDVDIVNGGGEIPAANDYLGWCPDEPHVIYVPNYYTLTVYSSLNPPNLGIPVDWHRINWILNHKGSYSVSTIQEAIWSFDGTPPVLTNPLVQAALADPGSATYVPGCGEIYAIILYYGPGTQVLFIEGNAPCEPIPAPEFPTIAFPAATLMALGYGVVTVKSRNKQ